MNIPELILSQWRIRIMKRCETLQTNFSYRVLIKYCVFSKILEYIPDSLGFPSVSVSVHNGRSNTSAASEKTQYLMNNLYILP